MDVGALMTCKVGTTHSTVTLNKFANGRRDLQFVARHMEKISQAVRVKEWYGKTANEAAQKMAEYLEGKHEGQNN